MVDQQPVEEEVANPYNSKKSWDTDEQVERGFVSADDSLFAPAPAKTEVEDPEDPAKVAATLEEQEPEVQEADATRYQKTDYKKRYDDLKRHYDRKIGEFKSEKQRLLDEAKANRPTYTPPKTPEELATFRAEYSDVYDVAETIAHMQADSKFQELNSKIQQLEKQSQSLAHDKALAQLKVRHPDFDEITSLDKFHDWAKEQPEEIQGWVYRNGTDVALASRALDLFKRDTGWNAEKEKQPEKKPQKQPSAADAVSVKSKVEPQTQEKKVWTSSEINSLSIAQYEKHAAEIDEAYMEGRVING